MENPEYAGNSEISQGETRVTPSIRIDVRIPASTMSSSDAYFAASIMGLQALKCSGVTGYGSTEEEAVINLRRKVLQYLEFNNT